jgi:hypothetical protein
MPALPKAGSLQEGGGQREEEAGKSAERRSVEYLKLFAKHGTLIFIAEC